GAALAVVDHGGGLEEDAVPHGPGAGREVRVFVVHRQAFVHAADVMKGEGRDEHAAEAGGLDLAAGGGPGAVGAPVIRVPEGAARPVKPAGVGVDAAAVEV